MPEPIILPFRKGRFSAVPNSAVALATPPFEYRPGYSPNQRARPGVAAGRLVVALCLLSLLFAGCRQEGPAVADSMSLQTFAGETMGTTYSVRYRGTGNPAELKTGIDSLLHDFNLQVSTYIDSSVISRFNRSTTGLPLDTVAESAFIDNYRLAERVYHLTDGAFDPTVMPLVNYWGFGYTLKRPVEKVDSQKVDSIMQYVGFDRVVRLEETAAGFFLHKSAAGVQLDFSASAKGFGVDLVGKYLESRGINNYFVEIGGEVVARGNKGAGKSWQVGINVPRENAATTEIEKIIPLEERAMATSGNYRNYYDVEGEKYSHTINPKTGYPERSNLLSASVMAPDCGTADAFATACMVLGAERAYELVESQPTLEAYFIVGTPNGAMEHRATSRMRIYLEEVAN